MRAFLVFALAAFVTTLSTADAAEYWVDAGAAADGDGSPARPFTAAQTAVDRAGAGDTVWIRPGTYREALVVRRGGRPDAPLVIAAAAGRATFKGSVVVTGWEHAWGAVWRRRAWSVWSQQVFADGKPLQLIGPAHPCYDGRADDGATMIDAHGTGRGDLVPGSFCYEGAAQTLFVRLPGDADPRRALIEAGVAHHVLDLQAARDVVVRGLAIRHCSTGAFQVGGGAVELGTRCRLESCDVQWADFCGVHLAAGGSGAAVVGCVVARNGGIGITVDGHADYRVDACDVSWNNTRSFNPFWHAGGLKATSGSWGTITGSRFLGNGGNGVWLDFCDSGKPSAIERNDCEGNLGEAGDGIMVEASRAVRVAANLLVDNDSRGIYVAASEDVLVCANTITGTRRHAAIDLSGMPRTGKRLAHVRACDNLVAANHGREDLMLLRENGRDIVDLALNHDLVWRPGGAQVWWTADARGGWSGQRYDSLAEWMRASGNGAGSLEADPRLVGLVPGPGSPARSAGVRVADVDLDYRGEPMPATPTIGAIQSTAALTPTWTMAALGASAATARASAGSARRCGLGGTAGMLLGLWWLGAKRRR